MIDKFSLDYFWLCGFTQFNLNTKTGKKSWNFRKIIMAIQNTKYKIQNTMSPGD